MCENRWVIRSDGYPAARNEEVMAAMKPRTGEGPMEVVKEGRGLVLRMPVDGGGRLVVEINQTEAKELYDCLKGVVPE